MFTQTCIINKKYDNEFLNKLKHIGYEISDLDGDEFGCEYIIAMYPFSTIDFIWSNQGYRDVVSNGVIDCGTNEEMFLAIAALRDDSDIHQWFVDDYDDNIWQKSEWNNANFTKAHKATVDELIKHFTI